MNPFKLYYPLATSRTNQSFGANPAYYAKFRDATGNPLKGHDGIDFYATHGTPVYAAHDGLIHFERDPHGGEGMAIRDQSGNYSNIQGFPITMYWHLIGDTDGKFPSPIPTDGNSYPVKTGDLIGYADNTGAPFESSGDHLHFGLFAVDANNNTLSLGNGFNGRIDPTPFFTGTSAQDVPRDTSYVTGLLAQAWALLRAKFNLR
jgi:murein DD-endopeptidase MepM/ murein hydrolase activator NlpD